MSFVGAVVENETSSAAIAIFGVFALVGIFSIVALTSRGRRVLLPLVVVLLGAAIGVTSISEAFTFRVSPITFIGLFFSVVLVMGGLGAAREGIALPEVEGVEPEVHPSAPRITPDA